MQREETLVMRKTEWKRLLKSIEIDDRYGGELKPVEPKALKAFEQKAGVKLPRSYRTFCEVFGPGEFGKQFKIAVPGYKGQASAFSLEALGDCARDGDHEIYSKDPDQHARGIFFCIDIIGAFHFFDPKDVTDPVHHEYAVYTVSRYYDVLRRRADNFWQFVTEFYLGKKHRQLISGVPARPLFLPVPI